MPEIVTIDALGHRGDGIVRGAHGPLYVPFTLPGERVSIERNGERGKIVALLEANPDRVAPICQHFGTCGGCSLQMLPLDATRRLKRDFVVATLAQQKLTPEVSETVGVSPSSRRRAVMTALRSGQSVMLGYHERLSHRLVDVLECPVILPAISSRLPRLRELLIPLLPQRKSARVTLLATRGGLDVAIDDAPSPNPSRTLALADMAKAAGIARISVAGEPVLTLAEPAIDVSGVPVVPPPGTFVQASAEAETIMAGLVVNHLRKAKRVADLFSGVGTFSLALARHAAVHAVEDNSTALDTLSAATRRASGLKPITTERRDLDRHPLSPQELANYDGIVFDPPRNGAKAQALQLAASKVPRVAAVSCNPATFARDAHILVDGGYSLDRVVPVDQFVYSAETEVVGLFARR
jgi:23S rRNA (uracil1939-C5)-methyltransferase